MSLPLLPKPHLPRFHQARWDERIIFDLHAPGQRGVLVSAVESEVSAVVGDAAALVPKSLRRRSRLDLPEIGQMRVLKHYLRLSQGTLGADLNIDVGQGTCTMKYSPKVNERLIDTPKLKSLHPMQDDDDVQGVLEIIWQLQEIMRAISGMDAVSLQTQGGSSAIWMNASLIRAYHDLRGEGGRRREVITTIFSHPSNAAAAKAAGYDVITIYPDESGYPDRGAFESAISDRTAAIMVTNPEDTGIFNPDIRGWVETAHAVGALASYDQANANGILGITRAREAGFDLCHFNLHKTFSTPHGSGGPGGGVNAVTEKLAELLPGPRVVKKGDRFVTTGAAPRSIGAVAPFYGVVPNIVRAYSWIRSLGAEGLREVAEIAVLNNNYLLELVRRIPGASVPYAQGRRRIEQVRYSWKELFEATGVSSEEIGLRMADYGLHYWTSHHPHVVPQPFTLEPTESYSRQELDLYAASLAEVSREAHESPETVQTAPHRSTVHRTEHADLDDPERWAVTWRAYRRKYFGTRGSP
ncbi:aminomethyl-transferring glycine dehydrogenase subunit GcvPB [Xylanimonas ulmi]|uniref:glycine dehydrogenase (aminomethyl-transferring) n=1 Tax=Xylanimonas ulmi TaxID=228973 RepID=A0A4Q7LYQ3_9MICO|nr:aminomethyl-transferring glycine dehydrogenase subunit GcvPB [Xylanibacterium ulmi]RZS59831.1 glycine dehydrogenase (decarboxylating) beta subunit [Xylanibacterium ulmi]